jgi:glycosyltransferase involved in cell wall biosynthesis
MVYLGVLARRKGFFDAVEAFLSRGSDWKMVCIGTAGTERERKDVESFLSDRNAGQRVVMTGAQSASQIIEWFRRSPLFLLPSYTDTGPTALKEALAMGLWPVCYDNTGPKELIERYKVGTRVPTGDRKALAAALWKTVSGRPWENRPALEACVTAIRGHLSPAAAWRELDGVYDRVMG